MTNPGFTHISQYRDVESRNHFQILQDKGLSEEAAYQILKIHSRDNSRTPMQWDDSQEAGFTTGEPWIGVTDNYRYINVEAERRDEDSIFHYYQKLIQLRKDYDVVAYGDFKPVQIGDKSVFAYERSWKEEKLLVINNFYGREVTFDAGCEVTGYEKLLGNYPGTLPARCGFRLRPFETLVLYRKDK